MRIYRRSRKPPAAARCSRHAAIRPDGGTRRRLCSPLRVLKRRRPASVVPPHHNHARDGPPTAPSPQETSECCRIILSERSRSASAALLANSKILVPIRVTNEPSRQGGDFSWPNQRSGNTSPEPTCRRSGFTVCGTIHQTRTRSPRSSLRSQEAWMATRIKTQAALPKF